MVNGRELLRFAPECLLASVGRRPLEEIARSVSFVPSAEPELPKRSRWVGDRIDPTRCETSPWDPLAERSSFGCFGNRGRAGSHLGPAVSKAKPHPTATIMDASRSDQTGKTSFVATGASPIFPPRIAGPTKLRTSSPARSSKGAPCRLARAAPSLARGFGSVSFSFAARLLLRDRQDQLRMRHFRSFGGRPLTSLSKSQLARPKLAGRGPTQKRHPRFSLVVVEASSSQPLRTSCRESFQGTPWMQHG